MYSVNKLFNSSQNEYMQNELLNKDITTLNEEVIKSNLYVFENIPLEYKLDETKHYNMEYNEISQFINAIPIRLFDSCDFVNNINIKFKSTETYEFLKEKLYSIDIEFGGSLYDRIYINETTIKLLNLFNDETQTIQFNQLDMFGMTVSIHHIKRIILNFNEKIDNKFEFTIFGNKYYQKNMFPSNIYNSIITNHSQVLPEKIVSGENKIRLNLNHPVCLIYLSGIDPKNITNVKLSIDGGFYPTDDKEKISQGYYYDTTSDELEKLKKENNIPTNDLVIIFNNKFDSKNLINNYENGSINFSRIDNATLYITTTINEPRNIFVGAIHYQVSTIMNGMHVLKYTK